jgi:phage head maturation protease
MMGFYNSSATKVGQITTDGTIVLYTSLSDYRRKFNVQNLTNSGTFIDALKPRTFDWSSGDKGVGFIAHEFAEVSPSSVTGEKDAVDSDGKPVYQAMQASSAEVIANLVAELQSLRRRVAQLEAQNQSFDARLAAVEALLAKQ